MYLSSGKNIENLVFLFEIRSNLFKWKQRENDLLQILVEKIINKHLGFIYLEDASDLFLWQTWVEAWLSLHRCKKKKKSCKAL